MFCYLKKHLKRDEIPGLSLTRKHCIPAKVDGPKWINFITWSCSVETAWTLISHILPVLLPFEACGCLFNLWPRHRPHVRLTPSLPFSPGVQTSVRSCIPQLLCGQDKQILVDTCCSQWIQADSLMCWINVCTGIKVWRDGWMHDARGV